MIDQTQVGSTFTHKKQNIDFKKEEKFHTICEIQGSKRFITPLGPEFESNICSAIVLAFYGRKAEVCTLLQNLSHSTRAYCARGNGLKGFVVANPPHFEHLNKESREIARKFEEERIEGKKIGTVNFKCRKYKGLYNGEINEDG